MVKVVLFTAELKPLGEYTASAVPREGEHLHWNDVMYEVKSVTWENLDEEPTVQVRVGK